MKHTFLSAVALLLLASLASAQDFGRKWMDDVTNELRSERGPLDPLPVNLKLYGGLLYVYDSNIFLESQNERSSTMLIPWARARLDYAETNWSTTIDALGAYKTYFTVDDADDDEERVYARIGYDGSSFTAQLANIYRHESDPAGVVFAERIERQVNHTHADVRLDITPALAVELNGDLNFVRILDRDFDSIDNINYRTDLGIAWRTPMQYDIVLHGGIIGINYQYTNVAPPDVDGVYARAGLRGPLLARLNATLLAGYTEAESDPLPSTGLAEEHSTADIAVHLQYDATEQIKLVGEYVRQITHAGGADPFAVVDRVVFITEWEATQMLDLRARLQYDISHSTLGLKRDFMYVGGSASYTLSDRLIISAGVTYRSGEVDGTTTDWDNIVVTAGAAVTF